MSQSDYVVSNGTGAAVRSDINGQLAAIVTQNSGATEPATTYAYMKWADTTAGVMKMRNGANSAWIELFELDGEFGSKTFNGNITLNAQGDLRFADSDSSNWVAFQSPATVSSNVTWTLPSADGTNGQALTTNGSGTLSWTSPTSTTDKITEGNTEAEVVDTGSDGHFKVTTEGTERMRINSSGNVGIGTTAPGSALNLGDTSAESGIQLGDGADFTIKRNAASFGVRFNVGADLNNYQFQLGGSEVARIDSSGRLLVGTSSIRSASGVTGSIQLEGTTEGTSTQSIIANINGGDGPWLNFGKTRGTAVGGTTVVSSGDSLGRIYFHGSDGSVLVPAAAIRADVDGTPGSNDMPGRLVFSTTADGASSPTERLRIDNSEIFSFKRFGPWDDNVVSLGRSGGRWTAVWAANGTIQTSDQRDKTDIEEASLGSDFIKSLRPVSYKWIEGGKRDTGKIDENTHTIYESVPGVRTHWGFLAQEVKEAVDAAGVDFGGWVLTDKDDPDSQQALRYDQFIAPLTKALQEALAKIETLEAKVAALEAS